MDIVNILDEKNFQLLMELKKDYHIEFVRDNLEFCHMNISGKNIRLYYNPKYVDNESIAHELLHLELDRYQYLIGNMIFLTAQEVPNLKKIFTKFLCDYIENCFDHNKMYPKYIKRGYSPEKFLWKGNEEKCTLQQIKSLTFRIEDVYFADAINRYIGYLISIYADHLGFDYHIQLDALKWLDIELFNIVTKFWNEWLVFDIENMDPIENSYILLSYRFVEEMINWSNSKLII